MHIPSPSRDWRFYGLDSDLFSLQQEESKADTMLAKGQCISKKDCKIEDTMKGKHLKDDTYRMKL